MPQCIGLEYAIMFSKYAFTVFLSFFHLDKW